MELGLVFLAKKWLGSLLMPLNMAIVLMCLAFYLAVTRRPYRAASLLLPAIALLVVTSSPGFVNQTLINYERQIARPTELAERFDYIVVLGGGHISDPLLTPMEQLSRASLARIIKGIQLSELNPSSRLIVSGYGGSDPTSNAELMELVATQAKIAPANIITIPKAKNTAEEAQLIASYIGDRPTALVTSATHMPRSLAHFQRYSESITPVATDFLGKEVQGKRYLHEHLPDARFIQRFDAFWHEKLGIWWEQLRAYFA